MSKEYIDKDEFYDVIDGGFDLNFDELPEIKAALLDMIRNFQNLDPADVVPVVRCKDCRYFKDMRHYTSLGWCDEVGDTRSKDWYCADGERRETNDER